MEEIVDETGLVNALTASRDDAVFLFKHSTACSISVTAYREVAAYASRGNGCPVYMVKVIESRPVSNAISTQTGVAHKSPQLILVDNERAVWTTSHYGIKEAEMDKAVAERG